MKALGPMLIALALAGCGSSKVVDRVHSPTQVARVFAAHGLPLYPPGWTFPKETVFLTRLTTQHDPFDVNPRHLQLSVSIWWSDAAAAQFAKASNINDRALRVDNVVAEYHYSPYTAGLVSRLRNDHERPRDSSDSEPAVLQQHLHGLVLSFGDGS